MTTPTIARLINAVDAVSKTADVKVPGRRTDTRLTRKDVRTIIHYVTIAHYPAALRP